MISVFLCSSFFSTLRPLPDGKWRLLCPLHPRLLVLWIPDPLQHRPGTSFLWHLYLRSLLLLLWRWNGGWLQLPLWHGLWHHGCLLWIIRLFGNLYGMLWNLFSFINIYLLFALKLESVLNFPFKEEKKHMVRFHETSDLVFALLTHFSNLWKPFSPLTKSAWFNMWNFNYF